MNGRLILVSGLVGAGKTTLCRAAADKVSSLEYIRAVTTRPRRPEETDTVEYDFVTPEEYLKRREMSKHRDHNEIHGFWYGADMDAIIQKLKKRDQYDLYRCSGSGDACFQGNTIPYKTSHNLA